MTEFEDFHICSKSEESNRIADLFKTAGVRIQTRVICEIGRPEYVISVHRDDIEKADKSFRFDVGSGKTIVGSGINPK